MLPVGKGMKSLKFHVVLVGVHINTITLKTLSIFTKAKHKPALWPSDPLLAMQLQEMCKLARGKTCAKCSEQHYSS